MTDLMAELRLIMDNYEEYTAEERAVKNINKAITKKYEDEFNIKNSNFRIQRDVDENETDFLNRLQTLEAEKFDVNLYKTKAEMDQQEKLHDHLKN